MGRGHRSTVPGGSSCVAADHCGLNAGTRREDIHAGAVVGKGRANVRGSGGSHSQRFADPGGRVVACVCVVIARGHHKSDPGCNGALDGSIQRSRCAAAQAHICHGWKNGFGRHPINACNHTPPGTKAVTIQHPHRMDGHAFGYPIGRAAHSPRDVGSVAVAIFDAEAVVDGGRAAAHPARKFVVACAQARVQNIDVDTHSIHGIGVGTVQRQGVLVESVQPPGG